MAGPGVDLFDFMAEKLEDFMREHDLISEEDEDEDDEEVYHLGFTFSFPTRWVGIKQPI